MSVSEWDNEYARLARAASQLRSGIGSSSTTSAGDRTSLQVGLQRLSDALDGPSMSSLLSPAELQRRKRLVQHLMSQQQQSGGGLQPQQPQSQMAQAMRQQDDMIDELSMGVGRLKHQTVAIHDEARMHVNLLEQMDTNLDAAEVGLQEETRRAARLKEDQSVWRLQLIAAGLFILLVLLILMGLSP